MTLLVFLFICTIVTYSNVNPKNLGIMIPYTVVTQTVK